MSFLRQNRIAVILILVGALLLIVGVWREETEVVFRKAVNICMECIGLG